MANRKNYSDDTRPEEAGGFTIEGRHAVLEALRSRRTIDKVYTLFGSQDASLAQIRDMARSAGIAVSECDRRRLDAMSVTGAHQGVIALAAAHEYAALDDIIGRSLNSGEPALIVICDGINDPHNLGAIIRTAGAAGAHGVIIPRHRSVGLTAVVAKAAAGALEHVPVARVTNIVTAMEKLKNSGVWIYGTADSAAASVYDTDLRGGAVIVIGSEGEGITRLVSENCDFMIKIPMCGEIASLNASNAAAVVLFEAFRQRNTK